MSIASAIQNAQQKVAAAYTAVSNKGGTLPETQNLSNLPAAINSISGGGGGITPVGTIDITTNGTYNVTNYASANVNVSGGSSIVGIPREVSSNGTLVMPSISSYVLPNNVKNIGPDALASAFAGSDDLASIDFSSLTGISGSSALYSAFSGCYSLSNINLSNLVNISGVAAMKDAFYNCDSLSYVNLSSLAIVSGREAMYEAFYTDGNDVLETVDLSSLTTISGEQALKYAFCYQNGLINVDLSSLTTISGEQALEHAFDECGLTSMSFPSLTTINGAYAMRSTFSDCSSLESLSFPSLTSTFNVPPSGTTKTNQFNNMLSGVEECTVHFPSNLQSVIGSWSDVTRGFGGTNTTVLFDLPATT